MGVCGAKSAGNKANDQPPIKLKGALKDPNKPPSDGEGNAELADKPAQPEKVVAFAPDVIDREREKDGTDKKDGEEGGDPSKKDEQKAIVEHKEGDQPPKEIKLELNQKPGSETKLGSQKDVMKPAADKAKAVGSDLKRIANEGQPQFATIDKEKGLTNTGQTSKSSVAGQPVDPEQLKKRDSALQAMKNLKQMEGRPLNTRDIPIVVTDDVK